MTKDAIMLHRSATLPTIVNTRDFLRSLFLLCADGVSRLRQLLICGLLIMLPLLGRAVADVDLEYLGRTHVVIATPHKWAPPRGDDSKPMPVRFAIRHVLFGNGLQKNDVIEPRFSHIHSPNDYPVPGRFFPAGSLPMDPENRQPELTPEEIWVREHNRSPHDAPYFPRPGDLLLDLKVHDTKDAATYDVIDWSWRVGKIGRGHFYSGDDINPADYFVRTDFDWERHMLDLVDLYATAAMLQRINQLADMPTRLALLREFVVRYGESPRWQNLVTDACQAIQRTGDVSAIEDLIDLLGGESAPSWAPGPISRPPHTSWQVPNALASVAGRQTIAQAL